MDNQTDIFRKLKLADLEVNKYYTFYKNDNTKFYAQFINLFDTTLIVKNYKNNNGYNETATRSIPVNWIKYVESEEFRIKINNFIN